MSHEIDMTTGQAAVFVTATPAWHRLGKVIEKAATAAEAIKLAVLDWHVAKRPLCLEGGQKVAGAFATVRGDTGAALGVVGSHYVPFQNAEAFRFMDALVGEGLAMYETAGSLHGGKRVWILARIPKDLRVGKDDLVQPYVLLTNRHDGGGSIRMLPTSVRVCCQNTLNMALHARGASKEGLSIRHTRNVADAVDEARAKLGLIVRGVDAFQAQLDALARTLMKDADVRDYLEALYPTGKRQARGGAFALMGRVLAGEDEGERSRRQKRNEKLLEQLLGNYHNERNTLPGVAGTAWAAYNAVSEYLDHQSPVRGKDDSARANSRMNSIFFGAGNDKKQEAFRLALQFAGAAADAGAKMAV